jgi:transcriptional regulator with XRE-family HTH domain
MSELGLTTRACAEGQEFDRTWLTLVENGKRNPTLAGILKLAGALGVDASELVKGLPKGDI